MSGARFNDIENQGSSLFSLNDPSCDDPIDNWRDCFPEIIGRSSAIQKVLHMASKIARSDSSVLIYGESGTGKELIASALHRLSTRSAKKFIPINCSAIPETLLESELFGHEKGAFTGATNRRIGHFEAAYSGTIFLDEIGDMPLSLQAKLLRVLQEKQFTPVGSNQLKEANVRIIAATNIDLQKAVNENRFRLDLYYRLNVLPIVIPPLRQRREDLIDLIEYFLELANTKHRIKNVCYFTPETIKVLLQYSWPGNIRELQNLVERLVVINRGGPININQLPKDYITNESFISNNQAEFIEEVSYEKKPQPLPEPSINHTSILSGEFLELPKEGVNLTMLVEELENNYIIKALNRTGNNKNKAARLLGLNRTTLVERIKKRKLAPLNSPSKEL